MSSKDLGNDLPDGWIRKESKSRPTTFYYFNMNTGESKWTAPTAEKTTKSVLTDKAVCNVKHADTKSNESVTRQNATPSTQGEKNSTKSSKISDKSKEAMKSKRKTPAQDRLQKIVKKHDVVASNIKEVAAHNMKSIKITSHQVSSTKQNQVLDGAFGVSSSSISKQKISYDFKPNQVPLVFNRNVVETPKSSALRSIADKQKKSFVPSLPFNKTFKIPKIALNNTITKAKKTSTKTPAQDRLKKLQSNLLKTGDYVKCNGGPRSSTATSKTSTKSFLSNLKDKIVACSSAFIHHAKKPFTSTSDAEVEPIPSHTIIAPISKTVDVFVEPTPGTIDTTFEPIPETAIATEASNPLLTANIETPQTSTFANDQNNVEAEEMDWEPSTNDTNGECSSPVLQLDDIEFEETDKSLAYVVPDTNIFLSSLICVKDIIEKDSKYHIIIPHMVLQELDKLKHRNRDVVSMTATRAIKFIYEMLKGGNKRIKGQKATEDCRHLIDVNSPDDKILNCCLQLKEQSNEVILITNDVNLSNKAMSSGITTMTSKRCVELYENAYKK